MLYQNTSSSDVHQKPIILLNNLYLGGRGVIIIKVFLMRSNNFVIIVLIVLENYSTRLYKTNLIFLSRRLLKGYITHQYRRKLFFYYNKSLTFGLQKAK